MKTSVIKFKDGKLRSCRLGKSGRWAVTLYRHPLFPNRKRFTIGVARVLMAEKLGRPLKRGEHVHHKDEDKGNNRLSNLELLPSLYHHQLHQLGKKRPEVSAKMRGRHHTPEAIARMKESAQQRLPGLRAAGLKGGATGGRAGKGKPKSPLHRYHMSVAAIANKNHLRFLKEH